ncbi:MAG: restriction endonuclease [Haloferacaceae archaeon]
MRAATSQSRQYLDRLDDVVESRLADESEAALQEAIGTADLFVDTLDRVAGIESGNTPPALSRCLDAIRAELRTRGPLQTPAELEDANAFVGMLEPVDTYLNALPSLSVDAIVEDVTDEIRSGAPLTPDSFEAQFDRIDQLVAREVDSLADELETFLTEWRSHPAVDAAAWREAITEAREAGDPVPLLDPYRTMQQMDGAMWTRAELQRFSWDAFERLVANLYDQRGYETTVTPGSRDMGVDVWAKTDRERVAIQVKRYAEGNTVGREVVQKLESTLARDDADRVVVVTSSTFANTATRYAASSPDVELVDGDELVSQLTRYDVPASGSGA